MKQRIMASTAGFRWLSILLIILLTGIFQIQPALAAPLSDRNHAVPVAALKLVQFVNDPKTALDIQAVATLVDYVLGSKPNKETDLTTIHKAPGAYYAFDTRINFSNFLQYSYSKQIPSVVTSPSLLLIWQ